MKARCPVGHAFEVDESRSGRKCMCPECGRTVRIPLEDADTPCVSQRVPDEGAAVARPSPRVQAQPSDGPTATTAHEGDRLGPFELLGTLGQGGMGAVHLALHTKLKKEVALKVLPAERMADEQAVARFQREIQVVSTLDHPNIVRFITAGEKDDTHFFVMEYVRGLNLAALVARCGPLPVADACQLIGQAAVGLQHAHSHGLVHRDIKPSNLMLSAGGELKILDLGIARLSGDPSTTEELTAANQTMGTLRYMAPEQCDDSRNVDIRADIYGLGCTLYMLLTGEPPFGPEDASPQQIILAHLQEPVPSLCERRPYVPAELMAVLERMMAKDPADRFATPADVARALAPWATGCDLSALVRRAEIEPPSKPSTEACQTTTPEYLATATDTRPDHGPARTEPGGRVRQFPVAAVLLVGLALLGLTGVVGVVMSIRAATDYGELVIECSDADVQVLIKHSGETIKEWMLEQGTNRTTIRSGQYEIELVGTNADLLKMDNDKITLARGQSVVATIVRTRASLPEVPVDQPARVDSQPDVIPEETPRPVSPLRDTLQGHADQATYVTFSPNGKTIATASDDHTIKLWDAQSATLLGTLLGHKAAVIWVDFSPDGKTLASASWDRTVKLWDLEKGEERKTLLGHSDVAWSVAFYSDGRKLASGSYDKTIKLWDVETGQAEATLEGHTRRVYGIMFSPDGKTLASASWDKTIRLWDVERAQLSKILEGHTNFCLAVAFSPSGDVLASSGEDRTIKLWDVETGQLRDTLRGHTGSIWALAFTPDGSTLVSGGWQDKAIKLWDVKTGLLEKTFEAHALPVRCVAFSSDGKTLASASHDRTIKLWDVASLREWKDASVPVPAAQVAKTPEVPRKFVTFGWKPSWSPDGNRLAFAKSPGQGIRIFDLESEETNDLVPTGKDPAWSPDGRFIAYVEEPGTSYVSEEVWIVRLPDGTPQKVMDGGYPGWSPDGKTLFAHSRKQKKVLALDVDRLDSEPTVFSEHPRSWYPAISPDGIAIASGVRGALVVVDRESGEEMLRWPTPGNRGLLPAWSPDGKKIGFGGFLDSNLGLWVLDVENRTAIQVVRGRYTMPEWSPDGTRLAFDCRSSTPRQVFVIETKALEPLEPLELPGDRPADRDSSGTAAQGDSQQRHADSERLLNPQNGH